MNTRSTKRTSEDEEETSPRSLPSRLIDFLRPGPRDTAPQQPQPQPETPYPQRRATSENPAEAESEDTPVNTPLPESPTGSIEDEETPRARPQPLFTNRRRFTLSNLSSSSEEEDNVSLSSLASVKKAAELWGGGANTWEGGTPTTRETTPRATFKLTPAHPQWNLQAAGINPATGRPMMAGEDEEKTTAPTGATPKAPKQLPVEMSDIRIFVTR